MIRTVVHDDIEFELEDADIIFRCCVCKELIQSSLGEAFEECPSCGVDVFIEDCEIIETSRL